MKKITLLLAFVVCFALQGHAQVLIGNGIDEGQNVPFEPYYEHSYGQSIYLASEVNASGDITALKWYFSGTSTLPSSQDLTVYLGHTSKTEFASPTDWEDISVLTQVYAGGITVSGAGWTTITFDTPFTYNGTDNLIVAVRENSSGYDSSGDDFYNFATMSARSIYKYSDPESIDPADPNAPPADPDSYVVNNIANFVPNIMFEGISQACPTPYNLTASQPTVDGATFEWELLGSETAWEVTAVLEGDAGPEPTDSGTAVNGTPSFTFTGLSDSSTYNAYVRANCGGGVFSGWAGPVTFVTLCPPMGDLDENFDSLAYGETPLCWSAIEQSGNTNWTFVGATDYNYVSPSRAYELYNDGFTSGTTNLMLVSPALTALPADTHRIRFKAVGSNYTLKVGTMSDSSDPSTFTEVASINLTGTYASYSVEFPGVTDNFIAFRHGLAGTYQTIHIDDVVWEPKPPCADIVASTMMYSAVTSSTATIAWEAGGSETAWQYVLGEEADTDPDALTPVGVSNDPTASLSSLQPNTIYKYWVRSDCGGGLYGAWSEVKVFETACEPGGDFTENFESTPYGGVPDCWTAVKVSTSEFVQARVVDFTSASPYNSFQLYNSGDSAATLMLVSPPLTDLAAGMHRVKFKGFTYSPGSPLIVGTITDPSDPSTFTEIETINLTGNWSDYNVSVTGSTDMYFAFKHGNSGTYRELYVDDVVWEPIPTEPPTCASDATATAHPECGAYDTNFMWSAVPGADGYYISIGTTPGSNDILDGEDLGSDLSYNWGGEIDTTYYYTVTPYNANGSAVGCAEQSFTTAPGQCFCLSVPSSNDNGGITNIQFGSTDLATPDVTYYDHSGTPVDLAIGINNNVQISFATSYAYGTRIWIDFNDDYELTEDEIVFYGTSSDEDFYILDASFILDGSLSPGMHRGRMQSADYGQDGGPEPCFNDSYGVTLDFMFNLVVPSCTPPSFDTATLMPDCDNSQFFVDVDVTSLGSGSPVITDGTSSYPVTATGIVSVGPYENGATVSLMLEHGTDGICDIPLGTFTYSCPPLNDDICSAIAINVGDDSAGDQYTLAAATAQTDEPAPDFNADCGGFNSGINGSVWFTFVAPESGLVTITTDIAGGTCNDTEIAVYTFDGTDCSDPASLSAALSCGQDEGEIVNYNSVITFDENNPLTGGAMYYIQVDRWGTAPAGTFGLKVIDDGLDTGHFNDGAFSAYPNPVKNVLNLTYTKAISNVSVSNILGQTVMNVEPNAATAKVDMTPLAAGTYIVKVTVDRIVKTIKVIKE